MPKQLGLEIAGYMFAATRRSYQHGVSFNSFERYLTSHRISKVRFYVLTMGNLAKENNSFNQFLRILLISTYSVVAPKMLPNTSGTAQSCHQGASGDTA